MQKFDRTTVRLYIFDICMYTMTRGTKGSGKRQRQRGGILPYMSELANPNLNTILHPAAQRQGAFLDPAQTVGLGKKGLPLGEINRATKDLGPDFFNHRSDPSKYITYMQNQARGLNTAKMAGDVLHPSVQTMRIVNASRKAVEKKPSRVRRIVRSIKGSLKKFRKSLSKRLSRRRWDSKALKEIKSAYQKDKFTKDTPKEAIDAYFTKRYQPGRVMTDAEHAAFQELKSGAK